MVDPTEHTPKDWVALVLTVSLGLAVNILMMAVAFAISTGRGADGVETLIGENSTQIITGTFSGMIGVIGSYLGFKAGSAATKTNGESEKDISIKDATGKRVTITNSKAAAPTEPAETGE